MCKGTTNGEDVYLITIDKIPTLFLNTLNKDWVYNHGGIPVDLCIGEKVEKIIVEGIECVGSCCGHNKERSNVLISEKSVERSKALGYEVEYFNYGLYTLYL